jgi:hypothetical protein
MQDQLRERIITFLSQNRVGVLSATGSGGIWTIPVRYRNQGLAVECLVPRWADVSYHLEQNSQVALVIVVANKDHNLCWLHYQGLARVTITSHWTGLLPSQIPPALASDLYHLVSLTPQRLDLIDEKRGWGIRDTLE